MFNQLNEIIDITAENMTDVYQKSVEHLEASGNKIMIYTFDKLDEVEGITEKNQNLWTTGEDEVYVLLIKACLQKIEAELARCYWNKNHKELNSPFQNTGNSYKNDYFKVRAYYWGDDEDIQDLPNFETKYLKVHWYKHANRGLWYEFRYGFESFGTVAIVLQKCIESIRKDFGDGDDI